MAEDYTPTTAQVRQLYANSMDPAGFDRWLAQHDAQVEAEALREAAETLRAEDKGHDRWYADWLEQYAARIARGEGS